MQPLRTFADPVMITGSLNRVPRAFVRWMASDLAQAVHGDPIVPMAERARREGWHYRELSTPNDPQLADPLTTASIIHELSAVM